ncbi:MAG: glycosyltransferase family 39 protein [Bryobacteraceae bacterium]
MKGVYAWTSITLLSVLFGINVYRAATQSITCDEAFTYRLFVDAPLSAFWTSFDACNHVLHTLLTRISVQVFGTSEFTLRIPSLLGGVLYFAAVYRISVLLFGYSRLLLLSVCVLSLNPLVLDFLSASRGYGLALALFLWALYFSFRYLDSKVGKQKAGKPDEPRWLRKAGLAAGLSVASNLTLLVPLAALGGILILLAARAGPQDVRKVLFHFGGPAVVTAFLILVVPLRMAERGAFYVGMSTWTESIRELVFPSLVHDAARSPVAALPEGFLPAIYHFAVPALFIGIAAGVAWLKNRDLLIIGGVLIASVATLSLLHWTMNVPLPVARTGLYLIPIFSLSLLVLLKLAWNWAPQLRWLTGLGWIFMLALVIVYGSQIPARHYAEWQYDSSNREVIQRLASNKAVRYPKVNDGITVASNWMLEPGLNFYRELYGLAWMEPITRAEIGSGFDYYVLLEENREAVKRLDLQIIFEDAFSGVILARKP